MSGLDWNSETNNIVSCSFDKNIFIWKYNSTKDEWFPELVVFKSNLSILKVKWNPQGNKFAAACCGHKILIGYYDEVQKWWRAEEIKFHKSSVNSIDFDPSGTFLLSGGSDLKVSIHSGYSANIDKNKNVETHFSAESTKVIFFHLLD